MVAGPRNHPNVPNWPPQFEHSALDLFEGEAKLGDSLGSVFRAPYISVTGSPEVSFARLIAARKELAHFQLPGGSVEHNRINSPRFGQSAGTFNPRNLHVWAEAELLISTTHAANLLLKPCRADLGSLDRA